MRLLGVDFGSRRVGLAVVDSGHPFPRPKPPLTPSGKLKSDAAQLSELARTEQADAIVLGLPLEPAGDEGRMARVVRQLAGHLELLGRPVHLVDERLTSVEAERALYELDGAAALRKRRIDGEAACRILERFLMGERQP